MNITLIGLRGSGKTTIGRKLSEKLQMKLQDSDQLIIKKTGLSIKEIVKNHGWDFFRKIEKEVIKEIFQETGQIIATGGGVILDPDNIDIIKKNSTVVYLECSPEICVKRINNDPQRPKFTNKKPIDELKELLRQREKIYKSTSDFTINTSSENKEEITKKIELHLNAN